MDTFHPLSVDSPLEHHFRELLKENLRQYRLEQRSETWELLSHLKKRARKRRWLRWAIGLTTAISAMFFMTMLSTRPRRS